MDKEVIDTLKIAGICTKCRKQFAEPYHFLCWECGEKERERARKYYQYRKDNDPNFLEKEAKRKRDRYNYYKEHGYCTKCGHKATRGGSLCNLCYTKARIKYENNKWKRGGV